MKLTDGNKTYHGDNTIKKNDNKLKKTKKEEKRKKNSV